MKSRTLLAALLAGAILVAAAIGAWTSSSQGAAAPPGGDALTAARFELTIDGPSHRCLLGARRHLVGVDIEDVGSTRTGRDKSEEAARQADAADRHAQAWADPEHRVEPPGTSS